MDIRFVEMTAHPGGLTRLTITVAGDRTEIANVVNRVQRDPDKWTLGFHKRSHKRGLTANAYYWVLVEKLSKMLGTTKDEIHQQLLQDYGTFKTNSNGRPLVFSLRSGEDPKDVTPYYKSIGSGEVDGKQFIHYAVLKGSSEMTSAEFNDLLQGCIYEAKQMGIETLTPAEIAELEKYEHHDTADSDD